MKEHCTSHYLAEIFRDQFFEESSGSLRIESAADEVVTFDFERGLLAFAEGNFPQGRLSNQLLEMGLVPEAHLSAAADGCSDSRDLAGRLISGRVLDKPALAGAIRPLVIACARRAFSWPGATYQIDPPRGDSSFHDPDVLSTFEAMMAGIAAMSHFEPLKEVLVRLPGRLRLCTNTFIPIDRLVLKPQHGYILSRADGSMRMEEIRMLLPGSEENESLLFLYALAVFGILEFDPPVGSGLFSLRTVMHGHYESAERENREVEFIRATLDRMMKQGSAEMLGIREGATVDAIERGYESARRAIDKSRFAPRSLDQCRRELSLIEGKLTESYMKLKMSRIEESTRGARQEPSMETLNPEDLMVRREMVKTQAQTELEQNHKLAERYFQKAREYHAEKDYHNCIQFCQLALKFAGESAGPWALMADAMTRNPNARWQKMAEDAFKRACEIDPWNAEYHVALGNFYKEQGLEIRARKQYEKALEILPTHQVALAGVRSKGRRRF